jgi:F-type H+-transporting ATPase subunit b
MLLAKVAIPRIGGILAERKARLDRDFAAAEKAKQDSETAMTAYEKALADARANAFRIAEGAREAAKAASDTERAGIEANLAEKLAAAEKRIADIKDKALSDVGAIAAEATDAIVRKLIDADVSPTDVEAAVGKALAGER